MKRKIAGAFFNVRVRSRGKIPAPEEAQTAAKIGANVATQPEIIKSCR
jgi:hypothetical protein